MKLQKGKIARIDPLLEEEIKVIMGERDLPSFRLGTRYVGKMLRSKRIKTKKTKGGFDF